MNGWKTVVSASECAALVSGSCLFLSGVPLVALHVDQMQGDELSFFSCGLAVEKGAQGQSIWHGDERLAVQAGHTRLCQSCGGKGRFEFLRRVDAMLLALPTVIFLNP